MPDTQEVRQDATQKVPDPLQNHGKRDNNNQREKV